MPRRRVPVKWQVATDNQMRQVVQQGTALASPELAHSVHVEVGGLESYRHYWYQFKTGPELSPVGRTKTAPAPSESVDELTFAFASCQSWQSGYYTAYRHMAEENLDFVVHLGDYIYEGGVNQRAARQHDGPEPKALDAYRRRHALYKTDPDLQAAHAAFPFLVTWDDHEVENDYADAVDQDGTPPEIFIKRRAAAYQAYYEHMPLRSVSMPHGSDMRLYRRLRFGRLAEINVLDTRQYRSDQVCGVKRGVVQPSCPAQVDGSRSILGAEQERWLNAGLEQSQARWNVIAQQVFLARRDYAPGPGEKFNMEKWDGYLASQDRLMSVLAGRRPANPVVITGDQHSNWVADLKADFDDPHSETLGTEFVGTSISSGGDGSDTSPLGKSVKDENEHITFYNNQRGYVRCRLSPGRWEADFRVVPYVSRPGAPISTRATFAIEAGQPGAERV